MIVISRGCGRAVRYARGALETVFGSLLSLRGGINDVIDRYPVEKMNNSLLINTNLHD